MQTRTFRPSVNLFDIPELLPGARPSANPAQRSEFEQRCRDVWNSQHQAIDDSLPDSQEPGLPFQELCAIFPKIDADVVRDVAEQAASLSDAIALLLTLASGDADEAPPPRAPPQDLNDAEHFPSLLDAEGWEVVGRQQLENDSKELGSAWCDRAKAVAARPAPEVPPARPAQVSCGLQRREARAMDEVFDVDESAAPDEVEYARRRRLGQRKASIREKFKRASRSSEGEPEYQASDISEITCSEVE